MPRSSSSSSSSGKYKPSSSFRNPYSSVANTHKPQPILPPTTVLPPSQPTFGQVVKEGFALGTGQAIAHRAVSAILGPFHSQAPTQTIVPSDKKQETPCLSERTAFENCLKTKSVDGYCGEEQMSYSQCIRMQNQS